MSDNTCGLCHYYRPDGGRTPTGDLSDCCRFGIDHCDSKSKCQSCGPAHIVTQHTQACNNFSETVVASLIIPPLPVAAKGPTPKQIEYFNLSSLLHSREWDNTRIPCYCCGEKQKQLHLSPVHHNQYRWVPVCHPCINIWLSQWRRDEKLTSM